MTNVEDQGTGLLAILWWKIRWSSRATSLLHVLAMYAPFNRWRLFFYRLRGVDVSYKAYVVQGCFLEESRPWLIRIDDGVRLGAGVIIATHDAVYHGYDAELPHRYGIVHLARKATVCPGAVILPGVTVGENAIVAPGAVVLKDVAPGTIVAGVPAKPIMTLEKGLSQEKGKAALLKSIDHLTKYPWRLRKSGAWEKVQEVTRQL